MADTLQELTELFRKLGAREPEGWARSQLEEGIPQLARYLFLRQAWKGVISEGNTAWMDAAIESARKRPDAPGAALGPALERLLATGASREDLNTVARSAQWELLHSLCYLLEDPSLEEPEVSGLGWGLFQLDAEGRPGEHIGGLHESVLETDPTGREMRPRRSP